MCYIQLYTSIVSVEILLLWGDASCSTAVGKDELSICRNLWTSCLDCSLLEQKHIACYCNNNYLLFLNSPFKFFTG